ncbi:MAG: hypothetical protein AB7W16_21090 [Candidatus Obscuribacterales bacterium]
MTSRIIALSALGGGILLAGAIALTAGFLRPSANLANVDFPTGLDVRMEFHPDETSRTVELYPSGARQHAVAQQTDGLITDYWYRQDETLKEAITRTAEGEVRRHAYVEPDGVTYKLDTEFYPGGKTKKIRELLDDHTTRLRYFFANGVVNKDQSILLREKSWVMVSEDIRREDDSLEQTFRLADDGSMLTERFSPTGILTAHMEKNKQNTSYTEVWYLDDGKTLQRKLEQTNEGTLITLLAPTGATTETYQFHGDMKQYGSVWRKVYVDGKKVLEQWYELRKDGSINLDLVKTFLPNGKEGYMVWFADDGVTVTCEVIYHGDQEIKSGRTIKRYREEDGSLKEVEVLDGNNKTVSEVQYPEGNNLKVTADPSLTGPMTIEMPPFIIPYAPPQMH